MSFNFIIQSNEVDSKLLLIINSIITILILIYSFNNINLYSLRYYIISNIIILAYFFKSDINYLKIFDFFIFLQASIVIIFEFYLIFNFTSDDYYPIKTILMEKNWGEVFMSKGPIWNIGIRGNALLPFALMISFYRQQSFYYKMFLMIAVIFAGNFAYILALMVFLIAYVLFKYKEQKIALIFVSLLFIILFLLFGYEYLEGTIAAKADYSNAIRFEQLYLLITDLFNNNTLGLLGNGFGHDISLTTSLREYDSRVGFEMIWLYFMNQVGVIYFIFFLLVNIYLSLKFINNFYLNFIYCLYIFYALWNPQLLDTTHVIVIMILVTLSNIKNLDKNYEKVRNIYSL